MTSEQTHNIPKQPFPSCLSIDHTVGFLTRALKALEHAPESKDVDRAKTLIEEGIADVEAYREIHSDMRAWGQAWKDAFLEANASDDRQLPGHQTPELTKDLNG